MIKKIIFLLIIQLIFFNKFHGLIFSLLKYYFYSYSFTNNKKYENNNDNNNVLDNINDFNISFPSKECNKTFNIDIYFKLFNMSYIFSLEFNIIRVEFDIAFYYKNHSLIIPSDLTINYNLHLLCHYIRPNLNSSFDTLAFIQLNKYFRCIYFININEPINFGIKVYKSNGTTSFEYFEKYFFTDSIFNYNKHIYQNNKLFRPSLIKKNYYFSNKTKFFNLKRYYISKPQYNTELNVHVPKNEWIFSNINNYYFCFCSGENCIYNNLVNYKNKTQICKYKFFLNLIEENKDLYPKTDYLLADFPGDFQSFDDAFPIFKKLISLNKSAYYMTINKNIFENKNTYKNFYKYIIKENFINGDFLEKYFPIILRLRAVISGSEYISFNNLFYNLDYISFISLTHGINYFKTNLYKKYYGRITYHKIVISTSEKIFSLALQNGWKEKDLIKICLPKWDKFDIFKKKNLMNKYKSIFFFFTWRQWNKNITDEVKLKSKYFINMIELINNKELFDYITDKEIHLVFCLHHMLQIYQNSLKFWNNKIKLIKQNEIFHYISKSDLLITDFSSIIFDFMYQNKPYVMFIPDSDDPNIDTFYTKDYADLIQNLKNGTLEFKNKFFNINQVVKKIIYYINNNFQVESSLLNFYNSFNFTCGNNTMKFINYLDNL